MDATSKALRGKGRPPKEGDVAMLQPMSLRLPLAMVRQLDIIRSARLDAPDMSTLIRELLAKAIKMELRK